MLRERPGVRVLLVIVAAVGLVTAGGWFATMGSEPALAQVPRPPDTTWVAMDPLQCKWTPWEEEWRDAHNEDFSSYPRNPEEERELIVEFFARHGIFVLDFDVEVFAEVVLAVCSYPRGHTFFLLVHDSDVDAMLAFGFRVVNR